MKIDPYLDLIKLQQIKKDLCENGFYKITYKEISDNSIINIILCAQGKKKHKVSLTKKSITRDKEKIYMDNGIVQ